MSRVCICMCASRHTHAHLPVREELRMSRVLVEAFVGNGEGDLRMRYDLVEPNGDPRLRYDLVEPNHGRWQVGRR